MAEQDGSQINEKLKNDLLNLSNSITIRQSAFIKQMSKV